MKSVLISIQPEWCAKIANGSKTIEVRKNRPKIETPFKCYIYCTAGAPWLVLGDVFDGGSFNTEYTVTHGRSKADADRNWGVMNGTIIGEFMCDQIDKFVWVPYDLPFTDDGEYYLRDVDLKCSGMTYQQFADYGIDQDLYGWHISELKIYEVPKSLNSFYSVCKEYMKAEPSCGGCDYYQTMGEYPAECACDGIRYLCRAPQSWCYAKEDT